MLDVPSGNQEFTNQEFDFERHASTAGYPDIRLIMQRSSTLPASVATTAITQKFERLIDLAELDRLTNPASLKRQGSAELDELRRRRKALGPFLGSFLTCVLIRLPGICYTIEIDMIEQRVVHWEYQTPRT